MSPTDKDAYFDTPDLFTRRYDKAMISTVFTWDKPRAEMLAEAWKTVADEVVVGGPAYDDPGDDFMPGMFLKQGIVILSRGCPNRCSFCLVHRREGNLRLMGIKPGHIEQSNNFLACPDSYRKKAYAMFKTQKGICFKGGLEAARITEKEVEIWRGLRIAELWLACDQNSDFPAFKKAVSILLRAGFTRHHIHCYALIGNDPKENIHRLREIYRFGAMPFAQLYRDETDSRKYPKSWRRLATRWSRPAAIESRMKSVREGNYATPHL